MVLLDKDSPPEVKKWIDADYSKPSNLKLADCEPRAKYISHVSYDCALTLPRGKHYYGFTELGFYADKSKMDEDALRIDFHGLEVLMVIVNGDGQDDIVFKDHGIFLNKTDVNDGINTVVIMYRNEYVNNGCGLHSFIDEADGQQYVYTFFEAHYEHTVFPSFDQPDLKASFTLSLFAPASWEIISNENAVHVSEFTTKDGWVKALPHPELANSEFANDNIKLWKFHATPKMSPYLYAFCGGEYEYRTGPSTLRCPMKLYYRKSMAQFIDQAYEDEWFKAANHSVKFFEEYMNVAYPYAKMDHILVPEFNMGAMEQTGCITYTEKYLFKTPPTRNMRLKYINTIMHEIAHQWFGNLITMEWWDDLWLNEAFATFMSCLAQESYCLVSAPDQPLGEEIWLMLSQIGLWGLSEDQMDSTHPIATHAKDTIGAETIFDGISYGKGSAFLKTWCHYVGPDVFKDGVRKYFTRYMQGNASLKHFCGSQDYAAQLKAKKLALEDKYDPCLNNVANWSLDWLKYKGASEIKYELIPSDDGNKINSFKIFQGLCNNADDKLRRYRIDVQFFYAAEGAELKTETKSLIQCGAETEYPELTGLALPDAVLLNGQFHVFCKTVNSDRSNEFLATNYLKIKSVMDRFNFAVALYNSVKDGRSAALSFLKLFAEQLIHEPVEYLRESYISYAIALLEYIDPEHYQSYNKKMFNVLKECLKKSVEEAKSNGRNAESGSCASQLTNGLIGMLDSCDDLIQEYGMPLLQSRDLFGYPLNEAHIRRILPICVSIKSLSPTESDELIKKTLSPLPASTDVEACKRKCSAAVPTPENKKKIYELLTSFPSDMSKEAFDDYASYFQNPRYPELMTPYIESYFEKVHKVNEDQNHFLASLYFFKFYPSVSFRNDESFSKRISAIEGDAMFKSNVAKVVDSDTRRIRAMKFTSVDLWN